MLTTISVIAVFTGVIGAVLIARKLLEMLTSGEIVTKAQYEKAFWDLINAQSWEQEDEDAS